MMENAKNGWRSTTFRPLLTNATLVGVTWRRICTGESHQHEAAHHVKHDLKNENDLLPQVVTQVKLCHIDIDIWGELWN